MTSLTYRVAAIVCATCLPACATHDGVYHDDGIAQSAPTGTNIKHKDGYRRGGSSSTVKVIGRHQLRHNSVKKFPDRDDSGRQK